MTAPRRRGEHHLVVVNPRREPGRVTVDGLRPATPLSARGVKVAGDEITVEGFGYGVFALS